MHSKLQKILLRGLQQQSQGDLDGAEASFRKALKIEPKDFDALHLLGVLHLMSGRHKSAADYISRACAQNPRSFVAFSNLCVARQNCGDLHGAVEAGDRAIELNADYPDAYVNRGYSLLLLGRCEDALRDFDEALARRPSYGAALINRSIALNRLMRFEEALAACEKAALVVPDKAELHHSKGDTLKALGRLDEALSAYARACELNPGHGEAYNARAGVLQEMGRLEEALACYEKACDCGMADRPVLGAIARCKADLCIFEGREDAARRIEDGISQGKEVINPWVALGFFDSPAVLLKAAEIFVANHYKDARRSAPAGRPAREKIRLGYFSADFRNHPVAHLTAGLFEAHDRSQFEVYGFSFGPETGDEFWLRARNAFDEFIPVAHLTDAELVALSARMEIDIAIDLMGPTKGNRGDLFSLGVAPVQVNYLGHAGTIGADYMDYIVADRVVIPEAEKPFYREKVVYMPHSYMVNDDRRAIAGSSFDRADFGLDPGAFVFCCFNATYKITPQLFDLWMEILKKVSNSVLWLLTGSETARRNLRREAESRGVEAERLVFCGKLDNAQHLARQRLADLFLDTLPYNAHTTACDALWAGLPLLTQRGNSFAGRVSASLIGALEVDGLIVEDEAQYVARAVELATDPVAMKAIRERIEVNIKSAPLFGTGLFTRNLERAYREMHRRRVEGLEPGHMDVAALAFRP